VGNAFDLVKLKPVNKAIAHLFSFDKKGEVF